MRATGDKKYCPHCQQWFPLSDFPKNKTRVDGLGEYCKKCHSDVTLAIYHKGGDEEKLKRRTRMQATRNEVLTHYGGRCACCGEEIIEFLGIDHINGGGYQHRKQIHGTSIYSWLKRNNYPEGFRVLCHNCNMALGFYGYCPHKKEAGNAK